MYSLHELINEGERTRVVLASRVTQQPLASFTNNIHYIDRPNNHKTRLEAVCTIFCFLKTTSFNTSHNNLKILPLLSYRGENGKKGCLKHSTHCCFPTCFSPSLRGSWVGNEDRRIPAVSHIKLKVTEHAQ